MAFREKKLGQPVSGSMMGRMSTTVLSGFLNSVETTLFALPMAVAKETSVGGTSSFSKEPDILSLPPMDAMPRPI